MATTDTLTLERITPIYCGACGMPPEYCEYGPDFESHCNVWLKKHHPSLYTDLHGGEVLPEKKERPAAPWSVEQRLTAFYTQYEPEKVDNVPQLLEKYAGKEENLFKALVKKYGDEPDDPYYDDSDDDDDDLVADVSELKVGYKKKRRGVGAKKTAKVDSRVVIQKISRNRKKATTSVMGMETVPGIKLKEVSKAFSKKFAGSSSVKDGPKGGAKGAKEIIVQGDHMDAIAEMVVKEFGVPGDAVYLDIDGEFVPFQQE